MAVAAYLTTLGRWGLRLYIAQAVAGFLVGLALPWFSYYG